jgi:hypothetical protein
MVKQCGARDASLDNDRSIGPFLAAGDQLAEREGQHHKYKASLTFRRREIINSSKMEGTIATTLHAE